ncbi:MAG: M23 family metallopeptidase [Myxococcales bacterium]|nr:M23 family metallopeptidase [Myxococcales bacterium]
MVFWHAAPIGIQRSPSLARVLLASALLASGCAELERAEPEDTGPADAEPGGGEARSTSRGAGSFEPGGSLLSTAFEAPAPVIEPPAGGAEFAPGSPDSLVPVEAWLPEAMRCEARGARRYCNGPRKIAAPHGPARGRAERLGLGTHRAAAALIRGSPRAEWLAELDALGLERREKLIWPVRLGWFGRGMGLTRERPGNRDLRHRGVDITAEVGMPVRAVAEGLVAYADNTVSGYGNLLVLLHRGGAVSAYAHLRAIHVFPGQLVRAGRAVAQVGTTGLTRGPHLHFEWREAGQHVDPMARFAADRATHRVPERVLAASLGSVSASRPRP